MTEAGSGAARAAALPPEAELRDYWALLKPRVMSLVVFTALVGMATAPTGLHPLLSCAALLFIAIGAGASGALNMWWDADIDRMMERTARRPIPLGRVEEDEALAIGAALSLFSVAMLGLFANWLAAGLLALTIAYYLFVYTIWLKRRTPLNIVIGGAAGAFPPMIGWAAATGSLSLEPALLFAIIFLWTPPHSWALALFRNNDYARVSVPMLPVTAGEAETRRQIWLYSLALAPAALAPLATSIGGIVYAAVGVVLTAMFLRRAHALRRRTAAAAEADRHRAEKRFFGFSILYLLLLFAALLADAGLRSLGVGPFWEPLL